MNQLNLMHKNTKNVIWLQTAFLGDIILTTGAIKLLKEKSSKTNQYLITTPIGEKALKDHSDLHKIFTIDKKNQLFPQLIKLKKTFKEYNINKFNSLLIQPHKSIRSRMISLYLNLPTISYEESFLSSLATEKVKRVGVFHESQRIALLLEPLGFSRELILTARPSLAPLKDDRMLFDLDSSTLKIGIAPGSKWETKRWPAQYFSGLIRRLLEIDNVAIIMLGDQNERPLTSTILKEIVHTQLSKKVHNLVGRTSLEDLRRIYPQLNLMICNDSSPLHYASAYNIPTVAIFGSTTSHMGFGPLAQQRYVLENKKLNCRPCTHHGPQRCPLKHFKCMRDIKVENVFEACHKLIREVSLETTLK